MSVFILSDRYLSKHIEKLKFPFFALLLNLPSNIEKSRDSMLIWTIDGQTTFN